MFARQMASDLIGTFRRHAGGHFAGNAVLNHAARRKYLNRFVDGGFGNKGAAIGHKIDQFIMGKLKESGAYARPADTKRFGEILFDQLHARFQSAIKNRIEHFLVDHFLRTELPAALVGARIFGLGHRDDSFRSFMFFRCGFISTKLLTI